MVLAKYFDQQATIQSSKFQEKTIVELGAGCGLVGISIAKLFPSSKILITDLGPLVPLIEKNIKLNGLDSSQVIAQEYFWGNEIPDSIQADVIVASDCVWVPYLVEPFVSALEKWANPSTLVLIAYQERSQISQNSFIEKAQQKFDISSIPPEEMHPRYTDSRIHILQLRRKNHPKDET
eukprot:TRINITY_DN6557_c0_g1_i2.p1 TRINITY_DN6557_c0_g1~~TRINITY_DN6557_c0_g1_i2.p1  ORF type:complete len:179 (+),score=52.91 TRINITY_DN6557_c0_g1_i2:232-768(+)